MATNKTILNIEINQTVNDYLTAVQQDSRSRFLDIMLFDNGVPINLTGHTVRLYAIKPDGKEVYNNGTITDAKNGRMQFELTSQTLAVAGVLNLQVITYKNNTEILSTNPFKLFILESLMSSSSIQSSNEYGALVVTLRDLESAKALMQEMVTKIGTPGPIANSLNLKTMYAIMDEILKMLRENSIITIDNKLEELKTKSDTITTKVDDIKQDTETIIEERGTCIDLPNIQSRTGNITLRRNENNANQEYELVSTPAGTNGMLVDCIITARFANTSGISYPTQYSARTYTVTLKIDDTPKYKFTIPFKALTLNSSPPATAVLYRIGILNAQQLFAWSGSPFHGGNSFNQQCTHYNYLGNGINFASNQNIRSNNPQTVRATRYPHKLAGKLADITTSNFNGNFDNMFLYSDRKGFPCKNKIQLTISTDKIDEFSTFHTFSGYIVYSGDVVRLLEWEQ